MLGDFVVMLASENPVDHVANRAPAWGVGELFGMKDVWIWNAHVGTLLLAGVITIVLLWWAASKIKTGSEREGTRRYVTTNPIAHTIEVICVYLRDEMVIPLLGPRTDKFMPFLWTVFFFILVNNLLGLAPLTDAMHLIDHFSGKEFATGLVGATATQNIFVTGALAIVAALVINIAGIRELGIGGYLKHLTAGTAWPLWFLMVPIELLGTLIKPVALAIRLFANMTAGHILVAVLFMFAVQGIAMAGQATLGGMALGGSISLVSIIAAIAIYFLELFVAFLQAFVFMFLTAVFISQLSHHDEHEHHDAHDHEVA